MKLFTKLPLAYVVIILTFLSCSSDGPNKGEDSPLLATFLRYYISNDGNDLNNGTTETTLTYYISNDGNDLNNGTTETTAWHTIGKLNSEIENIEAGTRILFRRGDTFSGQIIINGLHGTAEKPIIIGAYGSGAKPIITGSETISGIWTNNGNIWSISNMDFPSEIKKVYINGTSATMGRYPKTGFFTDITGTDSTLVDTVNTQDNDYWNGAEIVIRTCEWASTIARVSDYADNTFYFPAGDYAVNSWFTSTYFVQNHPNTLTQENEWAYLPGTKTLYLYSTTVPVNVTFSNQSIGIKVTASSYLTIQDLEISKFNENGIFIDRDIANSGLIGCESCSILNNELNNIGIDGVQVNFSPNIVLDSNNVSEINNNCIQVQYSNNATITNNKAIQCGYKFGSEVGGQNTGIGIYIDYLEQALIQDNHIEGTSYNGISWFRAGNVTIDRNYIRDFCHNKADGAGIYTWKNNDDYTAGLLYYSGGGTPLYEIGTYLGITHGGTISHNIVVDGMLGYDDPYASYGIYIDDDSMDIDITGNTVTGVKGGIFNHSSNNIDIFDNTVFAKNADMNQGIMLIKAPWADYIMENNDITNNTVVMMHTDRGSTTVWPLFIKYPTGEGNSFQNNLYYLPLGQYEWTIGGNEVVIQYINEENGYTALDMTCDAFNAATGSGGYFFDWQISGEHSNGPSFHYNSAKAAEDYAILRYNYTTSNISIDQADLPYSDYLMLDGNTPAYPIVLGPFQSIILVRSE